MENLAAKFWDILGSTAAERYGLKLRVDVMTLGTRDTFPMRSVNISRSGALLQNENISSPVPFQNKTLLEIVIFPDDKILLGKIRATAKVVRFASNEGVEKALFGIHLLDVEDQEEWEALMLRVEETPPQP